MGLLSQSTRQLGSRSVTQSLPVLPTDCRRLYRTVMFCNKLYHYMFVTSYFTLTKKGLTLLQGPGRCQN